ncbi:MAG: coniferyl aldehyde dehydrogenase [Alteromonadaceae bacterium]|nr:coniferyl aldehyde dehydrogenase [Alteromonadaceae bacterium]
MADNLYSPAYDQDQIAQFDKLFVNQKAEYKKSPYPSLAERQKDLALLKQAVLDYQERIIVAMNEDFGCRSSDDTKLGDVLATIMGINYASKKLKKWMKPSKRHIGVLFQPAKAYVMYQPLGVVGIVTPWNYPLFLSIGPLTLALAAGNRVMIKMSEFTPATNKVINEMIASVFSTDKVAVIDGGPSVAAHFTQQAFDHLLFTGSTRVGKIVMAAAAQNLTPVTLELGGKSPTIIADDVTIDDAVSRFILAKTLNAGQTCVAPDYILCPENKVDELVASCKKQFNRMYPNFSDNGDYGSIINEQQFQRLQTWLADAIAKGAKSTPLANVNKEQCKQPRKMPLTMVTNVNDDMQLMQDEIFGPLLPIVGYKSLEDAITYINDRPRPLALYLCSHNENTQQQVLQQTHAGGVCINDAAIQVAQDDMPFGGIGPSGMGHYHGHEGFLTFSKAKSVLIKGKMNTSKMAFPPYGKLVHKLIYKLFLR